MGAGNAPTINNADTLLVRDGAKLRLQDGAFIEMAGPAQSVKWTGATIADNSTAPGDGLPFQVTTADNGDQKGASWSMFSGGPAGGGQTILQAGDGADAALSGGNASFYAGNYYASSALKAIGAKLALLTGATGTGGGVELFGGNVAAPGIPGGKVELRSGGNGTVPGVTFHLRPVDAAGNSGYAELSESLLLDVLATDPPANVAGGKLYAKTVSGRAEAFWRSSDGTTYQITPPGFGPTGPAGPAGPAGPTGPAGATGTTGLGYAGLTSATSRNASTVSGSITQVVNQAAGTNAFASGIRVRMSSTATPADFCEGTVTAYTGTNLTFLVDLNAGANASHTDWKFAVAGVRGVTGPTGAAGTNGATGPAGPTGPAGSGGAFAETVGGVAACNNSITLNGGTNRTIGAMFVPAQSFSMTSADAYIWQQVSGTMQAAIYDINGNRLALSTNTPSSGASGPVRFTFTALALTANTRYYLALTGPNSMTMAGVNSNNFGSASDAKPLCWRDQNNSLPPTVTLGDNPAVTFWGRVQ
jgi:hypothetical protein